MVKASKDEEAAYPVHESKGEDETLEQYYYRQQGCVNRNEVIPTWRKAPPDRNAEPDAYGFDAGVYGPKGPGESFEEVDRSAPEQHRADSGNVPSSTRNFGRGFTGGGKKAP